MDISKISIIIPAYNHGKELIKCLDSVFAQTILSSFHLQGGGVEVIVVNDGSTDNTEDVLAKYCRDEALYPRQKDEQTSSGGTPCLYGGGLKIITQRNQGAPVARNNGFKISKGEYLLFCDADAVLRKDALEKMVSVLEPSMDDIGYVYPNYRFGKKAFRIFPFDEKKLKENNYIHTMALIKREAFPKEGFDPALKKFQDWDLWLTMLENGYKGTWLDEFLFTCTPRKKKSKGEFLPKSLWLPTFMYKLPWKKFGIKIEAIEEYEYWRDVLSRKHGLL